MTAECTNTLSTLLLSFLPTDTVHYSDANDTVTMHSLLDIFSLFSPFALVPILQLLYVFSTFDQVHMFSTVVGLHSLQVAPELPNSKNFHVSKDVLKTDLLPLDTLFLIVLLIKWITKHLPPSGCLT